MNPSDGGPVVGALSDDSPVDELDERLVAYLDGELDPDERKELEIQLGRDAELRSRLRTLQDGWDLLDALPLATPSPVLLESTLRMAAIEATGQGHRDASGQYQRIHGLRRLSASKTLWVCLLSLVGFTAGAVAVRIADHVRFQNQLRQLPVAMYVDAYLHGADLELMRSLMQMPQWQQAVAIADQLGEWNFGLQRSISRATPEQRQQMLPELPIEDQQVVTETWQRFEQLGDQEKQAVLKVAQQVSVQSDAEPLLATMARFAHWWQTLPPIEKDDIASSDPQQREAKIAKLIQRTTGQWTQQTSRMLSDEDFDTIYQALRQIARLRINSLQLEGTSIPQLTLKAFGTDQQAMDPRMEAFFLRRLFEPRDFGPPPSEDNPARRDQITSGSSNRPPPPPQPRIDFTAPTFRDIQPLLEQIQGSLDGEELWIIESVLRAEIADFLAAASSIEMLREELLRSWAEDAIRRMSFRRSGTTLSERYELIDPTRRDQLDLLEPDRILESLRDEGRRRRSFP